jgi:hypothetical protein
MLIFPTPGTFACVFTLFLIDTGILTTCLWFASLPPSDSVVLSIHNSGWSKIKFVTEAQYLGLWMGQLVDKFQNL